MAAAFFRKLLAGAGFIITAGICGASAGADHEVRAAAPSIEAFKVWLAAFRDVAVKDGIKPQVYDKVTAAISPDFNLADLDIPARAVKPEQAEFVRTPAQYLDGKYLADLAEQGRKLFQEYRGTLEAIYKTYGVDPALLLALWGRETAFGTHALGYNALDVLATQAFIGHRKELFQRQFLAALHMVQDGVIEQKDMRSSWAGAMGLVQFLPEDYYKYAVDQDGDGRKDIWHSVPDALASLANNLNHAGWDASQPWGIEVAAPRSVDCSLGYLDIRKSVREWSALGIEPVGGGAFPPDMLEWQASLLQPAGIYGPAFLTFQNFQVIREYNKSDLYALFVGHLADRIRGRGSFARAWEHVVQVPTADVETMQAKLTALGFYSDTIDGKAGGRTRSAVGAYQKQVGLPQTCWPTAEIVAHIKAHAAVRSSSAAGQ